MAPIPARTSAELHECRQCCSFCDRVVHPSGCIASGCQYLYLYDDEETGSRIMCSMHKVFRGEIDEEFAWRLDQLRAALDEAPHDPAAGAEVAGRSMMRALAAHQDLHVLFSEFRVHADRSPATRRRFARRRRQIRATLAETVAAYAERADVELTMPADHLATVLLALTNGLALERLGQEDAVPDEIFGEVIATLFRPR